MANRTISTNQLTPNETFMVRGRLTYSRLTKKIEGEELQRDIIRRQQKGWNPIDKPYTTATICDARVIPANPNQLTLGEQYAQESFYQSTAQGVTGYSYTANNKGRSVPWIGTMDADGKTVHQVIPTAELAGGLDVTLVMRVFKAPRNNGITLDGVIINEPIRYYEGGTTAGLESRGLVFKAAETPRDDMPIESQATANVNGPFDAMPQPVSQPVGNPYSTNTQPMPNYGNTQNGQAYAPSQPMGQQPYPQQTPYAQSGYQGSESGGIRYNPADRGY